MEKIKTSPKKHISIYVSIKAQFFNSNFAISQQISIGKLTLYESDFVNGTANKVIANEVKNSP
jgi:hypothetical protein